MFSSLTYATRTYHNSLERLYSAQTCLIPCHLLCCPGTYRCTGSNRDSWSRRSKGFPRKRWQTRSWWTVRCTGTFTPVCLSVCLSVCCLISSYKHIAHTRAHTHTYTHTHTHTHTHTQGPTGLPGQKGERGLPGEPVSAWLINCKLINYQLINYQCGWHWLIDYFRVSKDLLGNRGHRVPVETWWVPSLEPGLGLRPDYT